MWRARLESIISGADDTEFGEIFNRQLDYLYGHEQWRDQEFTVGNSCFGATETQQIETEIVFKNEKLNLAMVHYLGYTILHNALSFSVVKPQEFQPVRFDVTDNG